MVAETPEEVDKLRAKCALESRCGLNTQLITGDEARALAPYLASGILAASHCDVEGHANPRLVTGAFARAARTAGAVIESDRSVVSIRKQNQCFEIETIATTTGARAETFIAERLVLAAGAWTAQLAVLLNLHVPVIPVALTMNVTEQMPPMIDHLIQHIGRRLSLKQVEDGNLLIGGGWPARLATSKRLNGQFDLGARPQLLESSVRGNLATAIQVVPSVRNLLLLRSWTGTVAVTPDQGPLLGSVGACPGLYIAAGGTGFTLGPTMSRLLSELIVTGNTSLPISQFSPQRYAHLNAFMGEG
jgi:glycine/D-amino acid oxidase-like deaminating enzyme